MPERRSNREELLELVTAVIDGEASDAEKEQFRRAAESDTTLTRALERERKIKHLIATRCKRSKTPDHVSVKIRALISAEAQTQAQAPTQTRAADLSDKDRSENAPGTGNEPPAYVKRRPDLTVYRLLGIAAVFLLAALLYVYQSSTVTEYYIVEDLVYEHYNNHGGNLLPVTFASESTTHAEEILNDDYNLRLTVPELQGARFSGVVYAEFTPDFHTPLLEYTVDDGDHIYVFAFSLDELNKFGVLERDVAAVNRITDINDVHIKEIGGKHVVSWKWHDVWYSAISNHDGETIAAMLPKH
ncbi:MAG: hypothetical protein ABR545_12275 [Cyclonatronaceae bacterium]